MKMMRAGFLRVLAAVLLCCALTAPALADYGYTSVSQIPMAVDFTVSVEFDEAGLPHVVTDYPFEETGATELNLVYTKNGEEAITLRYQHSTRSTVIRTLSSAVLGSDSFDDAYDALRNGELTQDDTVYIGTSHFSRDTDWVLAYSRSRRQYVSYAEKTFAQAFNAMGSGGVEKTIYYYDGNIESMRVMKRLDHADLVMYYSRDGEIISGDVIVYEPEFTFYSYDVSTGLFDGRPVTEFGFGETDLAIPVLAAYGDRTQTSVSVAVDPAIRTGNGFSLATAGGLLSGILIGLTLYYLFRRRKARPKEAEETLQPAADAPAESAAPEETFDSAPRVFHNH